jgi:hypothetical protein
MHQPIYLKAPMFFLLFSFIFLQAAIPDKKRSKSTKVSWGNIEPVVFPSSINKSSGVEAGKLPAGLLRDILPYGKLHFRAADAWHAMRAAAKADGVRLKPTSAGDTYRTYSSQRSAFLTRFQTDRIPNAVTRHFEGKVWYLKPGFAPLASPGTSNHNWGLAVDIFSASEPSRMKWLIENIDRFGWSWELVPAEPWHLRYYRGDDVPEDVQDWIAANPTLASEPPESEESHFRNLDDH